jgi:hypothetical protein
MRRQVKSNLLSRLLLSQIRRLAEVAVFGTLSETDRICRGLPLPDWRTKHGPHLQMDK